jgi:hypothetical protein
MSIEDAERRDVPAREQEADAFFAALAPAATTGEALVMRQALAGMLRSKQFSDYDIDRWLCGDPGQPEPPASPSRRPA